MTMVGLQEEMAAEQDLTATNQAKNTDRSSEVNKNIWKSVHLVSSYCVNK